MAINKNGQYYDDTPAWWLNKKAAKLPQSFENALLPYMSPEDLRLTSGALSKQAAYAGYAGAAIPATPTSVTSDMRRNYMSSQRATQALGALERMRLKTGKSEAALGAGYGYLTDVIKTLQRLGGGANGGMSRAQYLEFQNTIATLQKQAQDNYATQPYAALANAFINPTFSAGSLTTNVQDKSGKTLFGTQNKRLYA